jgi:hypothetical protein
MRNPLGSFTRVCSDYGGARRGGGGSVRTGAQGSERSRTGAVCVHGAEVSREQGTRGLAWVSPRRPTVLRGGGALASGGPALWGTKGHNT